MEAPLLGESAYLQGLYWGGAGVSVLVGISFGGASLAPSQFRKKVSVDAQNWCVRGGAGGDAACRHRRERCAARGDDLALAAKCRLRRQRLALGQGLQQQGW